MNMVEVTLHGHLADRFGGQVRRFSAKSAAEVVKALKANLSGWNLYLLEHKNDPFHVYADDEGLGELDLPEIRPIRRLRIVPAVGGAKSDGVQILIGAVLVVVGSITEYFFPGNPLGQAMIGMGVSMIIGGVAQMFAQSPLDKPNERPGNTPNYIFNGPVNMVAQGQSVPVGYGHMEVGSIVISGDIVLDTFFGWGGTGRGGGGGNGSGGGEDSGGCPAPWIPIITAQGMIRADEVRPGMKVLTYSEKDLQLGAYAVLAVEELESERWDVCFDGDEVATFSPDHRVWAERQNKGPAEWISIRNLAPGDVIVGLSKHRVACASFRDFGKVLKISIEGARTYIASGLLSHNSKIIFFDSGDDGSSTFTFGAPI